MKKRTIQGIVSMVCVFAICLTLLSGCGGKKSTAEGSSAEGKINMRFSWWGGEARHKATLDSIARYMELHPNIVISAEYGGYGDYFQKLATMFAGNTAPDVIQMDTMWFYDLMRQGNFIADIEKLPINTSAFDQEMLDQCRRQGILVALPMSVISEEIMITNEEFFKKYNLDASREIDWNELLEMGKAVHSKNPEDYILLLSEGGANEFLRVYIQQRIGGSMVSDDYQVMFTEAMAQDMFEYLLKLFETGTAVPYDEAVTTDSVHETTYWLNGHIAMDLESSGPVTTIINNSGFPCGYMRIPIARDAKDTSIEIRPGQLLSINNNSAHINEAAAFAEWFLTDPESISLLKDCRGVPAVESARSLLIEKNLIDPLVVQMTNACIPIAGAAPSELSFNAEIDKIFSDTISLVAYKQITPAKAAADLVSKYKAKLAELKG
jgi:oligogalacturonide transport system substrate-binding protein